MEKIKLNMRDIISYLIMCVISVIVIFLGMALVGNNAETFNDLIIETVAYYGTNETGELAVFWGVLFAGIPILLIINYLINKNTKNGKENKKILPVFAIELILSVASIIYFLVTGTINQILTIGMIVTFFDYMILPGQEKKGLVLSIIIYYFLLSLCTMYNNRGGTILLNSKILAICTIFINLIFMGIETKKKIINKSILIMQAVIPSLLLLYKCQRYVYNEKIMYFSMPIVARAIIIIAIISMFIFAIYNIVKKWKDANNLELRDIILVTTCMIIFAVNSVTINTSLIVPEDLHHTAEEVISYQQIIANGQKAYKDYSPVSGLFPVFIGAVLEAFGGNITAFNLAHAIFMIVFAMVTMFVLSKHLGKEHCLFIAMMFMFPSYDRTVWVLLTLLVLLLPKLIENKNLWLKVWIWLCFIGGIYYPSFGGAVLIGTLPFGIIQFISLIKENDFKQKLKQPKFYIGWVICLLPIVIFIPMLLNMAKHIMLYSSQTNLADGISVFGQDIPDTYLPYLSKFQYIRKALYYGTRYIIPISSVWIFVLILFKIIKKDTWKKEIKSERFLALTSSIITLIVTYTATIVRCDTDTLVSRPAYLIITITGILLYVIINKYMEKNAVSYILIGLSLGTAMILGKSSIQALDEKFIYANNINSSYEVISDELKQKYSRLGDGFITTEDIKMFDGYSQRATQLLEYDKDLKFLAWGKLGVYYTLDLTTVGQPSLYAAKDYKTHQEIIQAIQEQKPVIGLDLSTSVLNYYLYNWLLTTDEYVYDENYEAFLPVELFQKIYGDNANPTDKRKISLYTTDVGRVSNSLGKSLTTLEKIMNRVDTNLTQKNTKLTVNDKQHTYEYEITSEKNIYGLDADFMYIEFDINGNIYDNEESDFIKKTTKQNYNDGIYVVVSWGEGTENSLLSIMGNGKLLIPLGTNVNWLLNEHDNITITIQNVDKEISIKNIEFYKLQTKR